MKNNTTIVEVKDIGTAFESVTIELLEEGKKEWVVRANTKDFRDTLHLSVNGKWHNGSPNTNAAGFYEVNTHFTFASVQEATKKLSEAINGSYTPEF